MVNVLEGDVVRIPGGKLATVVAHDITRGWSLVKEIGENGLMFDISPEEMKIYDKYGLEPLPNIIEILQEGTGVVEIRGVGGAICIITENNEFITILSKTGDNLSSRVRSSKSILDFKKKLIETIKTSYVTRLPHLIEGDIEGFSNEALSK